MQQHDRGWRYPPLCTNNRASTGIMRLWKLAGSRGG